MSQSLLQQSEIPGVKTLGEAFSRARKEKKISASRAAEATRMKLQHVEAMERDDFSVFAAPAYAKGFIKIYAEYLGLDPAPLVEQYMSNYAPKERAPLMPEETSKKKRPVSVDWKGMLKRIPWSRFTLPSLPWRRFVPVVIALGVVVVLVLLISRFTGAPEGEAKTTQATVQAAGTSALIAEPPAPYLEWEYATE